MLAAAPMSRPPDQGNTCRCVWDPLPPSIGWLPRTLGIAYPRTHAPLHCSLCTDMPPFQSQNTLLFGGLCHKYHMLLADCIPLLGASWSATDTLGISLVLFTSAWPTPSYPLLPSLP